MRALLVIQTLLLTLVIAPRQSTAATNDAPIVAAAENVIVLPEPIADPLEPLNRGLWEVNKGLMIGLIQPTAKGYRVIVPKPLRGGIRNAGQNLVYPRRVVNNMLQERWTGARDETYRFLVNSVFGIGGLFDVGTRWGFPSSEADFGQTFGKWGWRPHAYLMLPIAGPSNERDALGSILDGLANPLSYFPPYNYITYGITYNNLTDTVDDYVRLTKVDFDPYAVLRYAWTLKRETRGVDLTFEGEQDPASLETLRSVFFTFRDPKFPTRGQTLEIPGTNEKKLPLSIWLQPGNAPLVYILPGIGSHRLSGAALGLAEMLYGEGYSVATISSAFNYEFMERGSTAALPGYTPVDGADIQRALNNADRLLREKYSGRIGKRALMGYSMGGFHTLYLAANQNSNTVPFERYVSIDAPVRLNYAISQLDDFFRASLAWPAAERQARIEQTFAKVAALSRHLDQLSSNSVIPFSAVESKFLIGLAFRLNLRDVIFLSQTRTNQHVLQNPIDPWRREPVYREILQLSFEDYLHKFVEPYYRDRGIDLGNPREFRRAVDLRVYTDEFKASDKVRAIVNANDILLGDEGLSWISKTLPSDSLTVFERGGHLGNLTQPEVQRAILDSIADLKTQPKHVGRILGRPRTVARHSAGLNRMQ